MRQGLQCATRNKVVRTCMFVLVYGGCMCAAILRTATVEATEEFSRSRFLTTLAHTFSGISTYRCSMRLERFEDPPKEQCQLFWYKAPGFMRIVQKGPFRKGAVLVIRPDGTIKAHLGGMLSFIKVGLRPDDPRLIGVTDDSALTADYGSIIKAALDAERTVTRYDLHRDRWNGIPVIILDSYSEGPITLYRMVVEQDRPVILQLERFKGTRCISRVTWQDIEVNVALSDALFDL